MKKKNIVLCIVISMIVILFTTYSIRNQEQKSLDNSQNETSIVAPIQDKFEIIDDNFKKFINKHHDIEVKEEETEEKEEIIWIDKADYTLMTKSQINKRIESLEELIFVVEKWDNLSDIREQAIAEVESAKLHLEENNYLYPYTEEDFLLLSYMIHIEAGASIATDEEQCLVGSVIINRRNQGGINKNLIDPTIKDIINEAGQYAICRYDKDLGRNTFYVDVNSVDLSIVLDRCKENARKVLEGEFTCPENVVFQALFPQGEIYKTFYHEAPFNNTTYFCYGR